MSSLRELRDKAKSLGASEFNRSSVKGKRFYVVYNNKKIDFASKTGSTFIDHRDNKIRDAWYARHSKITDKDGNLVINDKSSPSYWSARLLW
jgi:hypothetical protein